MVLPNGDIVNLGGRTLKNVVGYDLLHIFISSEGTLGVVTKAELKLNPLPQATKTIMAVYEDAAAAGESVFRVLEKGVIPAKIEFIDNWIINRIEEMMPMGLPKDADAILLFQTDGTAEAVEKEAEKIVEIVKKVRRARSEGGEEPGRGRSVLGGSGGGICRHVRENENGIFRRRDRAETPNAGPHQEVQGALEEIQRRRRGPRPRR